MMNQVPQQHLPPGSGYPFNSEQEYNDQITPHARNNTSFAAGVPGQLRRDGILATDLPQNSSNRYGALRPDTGYQTGAAFSDSGSGSISTSPSGNASSAYSYASFPRYSDISRYYSEPNTPKSILPTAMPLETYGSAYQSAATHAGHSAMIESPPFNQQENYGTITSGGTTVIPNIEAKIEKGFFLSSNHVWTCYRRNSFAINVSFSLTPWTPNARLYIEQGNGKAPEQIQSMAVSLTAAVDGHTGKTIELIQQTPKRNNGPQLPMKKELLTPNPPSKNHDYSAYSLSNFYQSQAAPGPQLPLQTDNKSSQSYSPTSHPSSKFLHAFERIQFKTATANNSKRRAQQQYYCLIVELWANIQTQREDSPRWVKVAAKLSHPVVVRGRSPSHYYHEKLYKAAARDPGSSNYGGAGQNGMSSRGSNAYSTHGNVLSGVGATAMGGSVYSGSTYFLDPSPSGSHSISSASSMSGGPAEGLVGDQHMVDDDAREEKRVKTTSIDADLRTSAVFECPLSAVRNDMGLPSTCSDSQAGSISQLQIHLLRHHNIAVNYCVVCSRIIVDTNLFELNHGTNCRDPRPPPRRILAMQQQWKDMYVSLRQKIESTADDVPVDDRKQKDSTQLATGPEDDTTCLIPQRPEEGLKREEETLKHDEISKADYPVSAEVCLCPAQSKASTEKYERHALSELADRLPSAWEEVQDLLPESYKWDIEYVITHHQGRLNPGCWTCAPLDGVNSQHIPLSIAGTPVVIPVEHQWPPVGDLHPPPDPRPSTIIDCYTELPMDTIRDIFITFDGSLGFYILISGFLQIIVSDTFDTTWASSHLPHKYGGLKVCYISNTLEPTMLQSNVATTPRAGGLPHTQPSNVLSASKPVRSGGLLQLNDFIEARVSSTSRDKFAGRIGLRVAKDSQPYLVMSTHTITEAILSKSFFGLNREPMKRLQDDWNKHAEIWAGNVKIGTIEKTYDPTAGYYPTNFNHDITLIRPSAAACLTNIKSPVTDIGWLCRSAWSSLRQQPSALKILGPTDTARVTKCMKCNTRSETSIVGEGIFFSQIAAAGAKPTKSHDLATWEQFVSRAVLYRVNPDFSPSSGHSGMALYAEGVREDGTHGPGIVGFQSFVQRSDHPQKFNMPEGPHLEQRLKEGRVAFYGAFQVPDELRTEYSIM